MNTAGLYNDQLVNCLRRLATLAEQKNQVLRQGRPAQLQVIVEAEEEALAELVQLQQVPSERVPAEVGDEEPWAAARKAELAEAVNALQRWNTANAAILAECLSSVAKCLELLAVGTSPTYSAEGKGCTAGMRHLLDVTG